MKRTFFIDTDSELNFQIVSDLGLELIKMPYILDGELNFDDGGKDVDYHDFFEKLRGKARSSTAALNTQDYLEIFEPHFKNGEEMFYLTFSREMSATFNFMDTAIAELKAKYPDAKFRDFDSRSISVGSGIQCYYAGKMYQEGKSFEEIEKFLKEFSNNIMCYFAVDDINHLKRGGRLSGTAAFAANLLNLKPILKVTEEGKIVKETVIKGSKKVNSYFTDLAKNNIKDVDKYKIFLVHGDCIERAEELKAHLEKEIPNVDVTIQMVGCVIGSHCGPGTLGIIFHSTHR